MKNPTDTYEGNDPRYWNDKWISVQQENGRISSPSRWDSMSETYHKIDSPSTYIAEFLKLTKTTPGERILDMGCGPGNLAIPLAKAGCRVTAADFSLGMLTKLKEFTPESMQASINPILMSWEDDWHETPLYENCVQTAISSRSISKMDLLDSIAKLSWAASDRCIVTVSADFSPKVDQRIFEICGIKQKQNSDHYYLLQILKSLGASPTCKFIPNQRTSRYSSFEEAAIDYRTMLKRCMNIDGHLNENPQTDKAEYARASKALANWLEKSLVQDEINNEAETAKFTLANPRVTTWAYVTWNPNSIPQDLY